MSDLKLSFSGIAIRDDGEFLCLTDIYKAAGSPKNKNPNDWMRLESTKEFLGYLETTVQNRSLVRTVEGRNGGTWAYWQPALTYAKYLSPAFHKQCNSIVRNYMTGLSSALASPQQVLTTLLVGQQEQTALLTLMFERLDRQTPPSPIALVSTDRQQRLVRRARTLHRRAKPVWDYVARARGYRPADEIFSTVTEGEFDIVWSLIEAYRSDIVPATKSRQPQPVPTHTFDGKTLKKPFNGKKGALSLEQLTVAFNRRNGTNLSEDAVDKLIDQARIRAVPWMATDRLERDVWDEDGLNWMDETYKAGMGLGRKVQFAPN